jgi:hypothetical protein
VQTVSPQPTRCVGWRHRSCLGHYIQPKPGEIVHLDGPNYTRVSSEPGWFVMGYIGNDGRLTEIIDQHGEAFIVRRLRDGQPDASRGYMDQPQEWEAVHVR